MSNGKPSIDDLTFDEPAKPASKMPSASELTFPEDEEKTDPGFLAGAGRFVRGAAVEAARMGLQAAPFMPPGMAPVPMAGEAAEQGREWLKKKFPQKDWAERAGAGTAQVLPSLAIPELGLGGLAARALPNAPGWASFLGRAAEGMVRGGLGGAISSPEEDLSGRAKSTAVGITAGGGAQIAGAALNAIPYQWQYPLNAVIAGAATKALEGMGIMPSSWQFPMFFGLLHSRLTDLAAQAFSKINPAFVGAGAAKARPLWEKDKDQ